MTDWSKEAATAYIGRRAADGMIEAKAQREQKVLLSESSDLWKSLASLFEENCRDFNQDVGEADVLHYQRTGGHSFSVSRKDTARLIEAELLQSRNLVRIKGHDGFNYFAQYKMCVKPGSTDVHFCSGEHVTSKEIIMRHALNGLLNIP